MNNLSPIILNSNNEKIDTLIEWDDSKIIKANVIMVHGLGTDKNETANYFVDVSHALVADSYRVIRFDLTGYGASEGQQRDACYSKHVGDLFAVHTYTTKQYSEPIYIFAQSMGCFVTALADIDGIKKTIMTGLPNADTKIIIDRVSARFGSRPGAVLNYDGISLLPRSTGAIQEIGPRFWEDIYNLNPVKTVGEFAKKTNLLVVSWDNDEIIGKETLDQYDTIPELRHIWLPGDHSVANHDEREGFIQVMLDYYNNS